MSNTTLESNITVLSSVSDISYEGIGISGGSRSLDMSYSFLIEENKPSKIIFKGITEGNTFKNMLEGVTDMESLKLQKKFLKNAFINRSKQYNFLQLSNELINDFLTEEDFEQEIDKNQKKYVIDSENQELNFSELKILSLLVEELSSENVFSEEIDVDEISELFEVNLDNSIHIIERK